MRTFGAPLTATRTNCSFPRVSSGIAAGNSLTHWDAKPGGTKKMRQRRKRASRGIDGLIEPAVGGRRPAKASDCEAS